MDSRLDSEWIDSEAASYAREGQVVPGSGPKDGEKIVFSIVSAFPEWAAIEFVMLFFWGFKLPR